MKTGFFEQKPQVKSMIRLLSFLGFCLGGSIAVWGLVLLTMVVQGILKGKISDVSAIGSLILLVSVGLGLAGGGEVLKVVQQRSEAKETKIDEDGITQSSVVDTSHEVESGK